MIPLLQLLKLHLTLYAGGRPVAPEGIVCEERDITIRAHKLAQATVGSYPDPVNWDCGVQLRYLDTTIWNHLEPFGII